MDAKDKKEREILDRIEDAEIELEQAKSKLFWWTLMGTAIILPDVAATITGIITGYDPWFIGTIILSIGLLFYVIGTCFMFTDGNLGTGKAQEELRKARRDHRNHIMEME